MSIDKKALFNLSSEPYLKPISDLGVGFYNLDENTAVLQFQLSNSKGPLLISENNLTAYAYFESANGSASDVIELNIVDGIKGLVEITLDTAFLQASTSTTVKGQVYIAVNNHDGDPAYNEVAVFREFTFEVADALINKISAFTKVENIRMFNQLKIHIEQRVNDIDAAIANGEDYVAQMNATLLNGKTQLNQIVADGTATIDGTVTQAKADITAKIDSATSEITTLSNNTKTDVQNTADNAITEITNTSNTATTHLDTKVAEFNQTVLDNGFVTPEQLTTDLDALTWQKYKFTDEQGARSYISGLDLLTAPPGLYESTQTVNGPLCDDGTPDTGFIESDITVSSNGRRKIVATRSSFNRTYVKTLHTDGYDTGWKELTTDISDTGWIPYNTINGVEKDAMFKNDTDNGFDCAYRIIKQGDITTRKLRVNARNLTNGVVFAELPSQFAKNYQKFVVATPRNKTTGIVDIIPTGELKFNYYYNTADWVETDYIYGEFTWHD
ncbi:BppU family phage baseplate upper protein [Staphylococcus carnosus]|uniref:BppU family phage baseplate upper protein n=1 Tax=Staphylococcus carnosus TaxID=1281 RepID=UPI0006ABDC95|nr:BppU family phage baseplate upper protein [Staphylococcus carnosus]